MTTWRLLLRQRRIAMTPQHEVSHTSCILKNPPSSPFFKGGNHHKVPACRQAGRILPARAKSLLPEKTLSDIQIFMTAKDVSKIVKYWLEAANHDIDMAFSLFRTGKYDYCLFLCHLALEKLLKSLAAKVIKDHPPLTHNLLYLAGKADVQLSKYQVALLDEINKFNMEARYPEDLRAFYKKADKVYAKKYLEATKEMWKWLQKK